MLTAGSYPCVALRILAYVVVYSNCYGAVWVAAQFETAISTMGVFVYVLIPSSKAGQSPASGRSTCWAAVYSRATMLAAPAMAVPAVASTTEEEALCREESSCF